ncbi:FecR family protein [Filimonas lacunae]|uniref:FecR family protein n=1 Tax=Filimonas lacunae TaxID=477680 RepID=A0A173MAZ2_9BACT|nr:FecR family protein [Filimonas lacunae]BAV04690.1 anti-sigma factor [Filimonas lacunae]SIT32372.1 FecR family protein [Filimonas lacunae]
MNQAVDIPSLLIKLEKGTCSPEEAEMLITWMTTPANQQTATAMVEQQMATPVLEGALPQHRIDSLERGRLRILENKSGDAIPVVHRVHLLRRKWWWAAAAFIGISATAVIALLNRQPAPATNIARYKSDIQPGRNGAILAMGNGKTILLDTIANGSMAGIPMVKTGEGSITYQGNESTASSVFYNTLSTPPARKFSMQLPDGSTVWLNAASSVTFPSAFAGKERKIEITGEAYVEVKTDKNKPFIVKAGNKEINVLGTSFNINAYTNEPVITTTLVEGSVEVRDNQHRVLLHPGEQANDFTVATANLDQNLAWKNGKFNFDQTDLKSIMRQVSRWYNVNVVFEKDAPSYDFTAKLPDNLPVSEVLKLLEMTKLVHFEIEGNTIIVKK